MSGFVVETWGDFACFTRPEAKVERLSYPVMTPSAARGILDAIYAKPIEFGWRVDRIEVMNPIQFIALRRNEVKDKVSSSAVLKAMKSGQEPPIVICDATGDMAGTDQKGRTQRQTIALKNVRYRIHAHIQPRAGFEKHLTALEDQAWRRITKGKCFHQPYLGCREFVAYFKEAEGDTRPIPVTQDIGWMVYDVFNLDQVEIDTAAPHISLFHAFLEEGVLEIPVWGSELVKRPVSGRCQDV